MCLCQNVTLCDCMSVRKWEVCGVEMALMELDVVHNRQDITSERGLKERRRQSGKEIEKRKGSSNNMAEGVTETSFISHDENASMYST